jgi:hypothetical protein
MTIPKPEDVESRLRLLEAAPRAEDLDNRLKQVEALISNRVLKK